MNNISIIEKFINDFFFTTKNHETSTQNTDFIANNIEILKKYMNLQLNLNKPVYTYKTYDNIVSNNLCDYIINESETFAKNTANNINPTGWTTTRHANYPTTDLKVSSIPSLAILVNNIVKYDVIPLLSKLYNINKYFVDCNDIFIVKYDAEQQAELGKHTDGSIFSFNILLNHESEFEGGGTIFYPSQSNDISNQTLVKIKKGRETIKPYFEGLFKKQNLRVAFDKDVFVNELDNAYIVSGFYEFSFDEGGERKKINTRYSFVVQNVNGKMLIVNHHSSEIPSN